MISSNGYCDSIANINFTLNNTTGIINNKLNTNIVKVIDILGREVIPSKNEIILYLREDGVVEKRIILENN